MIFIILGLASAQLEEACKGVAFQEEEEKLFCLLDVITDELHSITAAGTVNMFIN